MIGVNNSVANDRKRELRRKRAIKGALITSMQICRVNSRVVPVPTIASG